MFMQWVMTISAVLCCACLGPVAFAIIGGSAASAAECVNESLRKLEPHAASLPDCRAYEQVSPTEKNEQDALGAPGYLQTSPDGDAISYVSDQPFPGVAGTAKSLTEYVSKRTSEIWTTEGLDPPAEAVRVGINGTQFRGLTEDLKYTLLEAVEPALVAGAPVPSTYLRSNETGEYSVLAPAKEVFFADSTPDDSYLLVEHKGEVPGAPGSSENNVYKYHDGALIAQNIVGLAAVPAVAGAGGPAAEAREIPSGLESEAYGGSNDNFYQQNTISEGGDRVFFTDLANGQIYARENDTRTIEVSATQLAGGKEVPVYWQAATPNGRYVFFVSEARLTANSTASPSRPDLYRYDFDAAEGERLTDLTTASPDGAEVAGTLGVSGDGSYVYFVAGATLAAGATEGEANLYVWHEGTGTTYITALAESVGLSESNEGGTTVSADWEQYRQNKSGGVGDNGYRTSRITPSGGTLLFMTNNAEIYRYTVGSTEPRCVSCSPSEAPVELGGFMPFFLNSVATFKSTVPSRNLSDSGDQVFFETSGALVPADTNGSAGCPEYTLKGGFPVGDCQDVYEWEADGAGSCHGSSQDGGCLYLISTGQSDAPSWFAGAGANGENVFFFTSQSLVAQDVGEERNIYDARVNGGLAAQNQETVPMCAGEGCRQPYAASPTVDATASAILSGRGELASRVVAKQKGAASKKCAKGKKRRAGKCVKTTRRKAGKKARRSSHDRGAAR
jgi:hypothetical protein